MNGFRLSKNSHMIEAFVVSLRSQTFLFLASNDDITDITWELYSAMLGCLGFIVRISNNIDCKIPFDIDRCK